MSLRLALGLLLAPLLGAAPLVAADRSAQGPRATLTMEFPGLADGARGGRKVPIKAHLPAGEGPFPVVIVSHGAGGDWDSHFAQARHLASHGYAVLCVEHVGSNRERMARERRPMRAIDAMIRDSAEVLGRPRDIGFAIDRAEEWNRENPALRGRLDTRRVGVMGHSFGAFTAMVACGMRPALDWLTPRVGGGKGLGPDLRDPRVSCGVALSPQGVGEPFFIRESFGSLRAPLLGITGSEDDQQNGLGAENRREAFALWPVGGHRFLWLEGARHLDFTDSTGTERRAIPSPTRDDVQVMVRAATLLFLDAHLRGDAAAADALRTEALRPYVRGKVAGAELRAR
jgi:predicted dienelactone hydrolase